MRSEATLAVPNSLLFIMDEKDGELPRALGSGLFTATPSCVAITTYPEQDGFTTIILTDDPVSEVGMDESLSFVDHIQVNSMTISAVTVELNVIASLPIHKNTGRVRI